MTEENQQPPTKDNANVHEALCLGKLNVALMGGGLAAITFTHVRPKATTLLDQGSIELESVVRARIVTSTDNLKALADIINRVLAEAQAGSAVVSSSGRIN
jgi:hypothetical protein